MDPRISALDDKDEHSPPSSPGPSTPRRQSDESSTARSEYFGADDDVPRGLDAPARTLDVWHAAAHTNLLVTEGPDRTPRYYVANRWVPAGRQPDVVLHVGADRSGPAAGCARFSGALSRTITLGLGGGPDDAGTAWAAMTRARSGAQHRWDLSVALPGEVSTGRRRSLCWRHGREAGGARLSMQNLQLVEADTGAVLAVFANNGLKSWNKKGKLRLLDSRGPDPEAWERIVLLSALALVHKLRRMSRVLNGYGS